MPIVSYKSKKVMGWNSLWPWAACTHSLIASVSGLWQRHSGHYVCMSGLEMLWSIEWLTEAWIAGRILSMQEITQRHVYWFRKYGFPSFWNISWSLGPLRGWQGWMISPELFHCHPKLWYMWCRTICSHPCCRTSTGSFNWSWKFGFWLHA
jgi:hypothetical protein